MINLKRTMMTPEWRGVAIRLIAYGAVNAALVWFGVLPMLQYINATAGTIAASDERIAVLDAQRQYFLEFQKQLSKNDDTLGRIERTSVDINAPLPFIELIEALGREQNLDVKLSVVNTPQNGTQGFQIIADGPFQNAYQYLRVLEFLPYQVAFSRLQLEFFDSTAPSSAPRTQIKKGASIVTRLTLAFDVAVKQ